MVVLFLSLATSAVTDALLLLAACPPEKFPLPYPPEHSAVDQYHHNSEPRLSAKVTKTTAQENLRGVSSVQDLANLLPHVRTLDFSIRDDEVETKKKSKKGRKKGSRNAKTLIAEKRKLSSKTGRASSVQGERSVHSPQSVRTDPNLCPFPKTATSVLQALARNHLNLTVSTCVDDGAAPVVLNKGDESVTSTLQGSCSSSSSVTTSNGDSRCVTSTCSNVTDNATTRAVLIGDSRCVKSTCSNVTDNATTRSVLIGDSRCVGASVIKKKASQAVLSRDNRGQEATSDDLLVKNSDTGNSESLDVLSSGRKGNETAAREAARNNVKTPERKSTECAENRAEVCGRQQRGTKRVSSPRAQGKVSQPRFFFVSN